MFDLEWLEKISEGMSSQFFSHSGAISSFLPKLLKENTLVDNMDEVWAVFFRTLPDTMQHHICFQKHRICIQKYLVDNSLTKKTHSLPVLASSMFCSQNIFLLFCA